MQNRTVIIFILGQAQALLLDELISKHKEDKVYIFSSHPTTENNKTINLKPKTITDAIKLITSILKANADAKASKDTIIYTPHTLNFAANKIYHNNKNKISLHYLFDGTLNYRNVNPHTAPLKNYIKKQRIKSLLILHKYIWPTELMVDPRAKGVKSLIIPEDAIESKIVFDLAIEKIKSKRQSYSPQKTVLVLEPLLKKNEIENFENWLVETIKSEYGDHEILIKPHPSVPKTKLNLSNKLRNNHIEIIKENSPAEIIFTERGCISVLSTLSSALLLIKGKHPEVRAIALDIEKNQDPEINKIINVMKGVGIEII